MRTTVIAVSATSEIVPGAIMGIHACVFRRVTRVRSNHPPNRRPRGDTKSPRHVDGEAGPSGPRSGEAVWKGLVEHSVLVRDCSSWPRLEGCLRVTVGTPAEDDAFVAALTEVLS